jgi:predicted DCC family thiol-disulfide oxidoreductase YuxK
VKNILLFDGVCHVCDGFVSFILRWDRNEVFLFSSLQSKAGTELIKKHAGRLAAISKAETLDSVILITSDEEVYALSRAIFKVFSILGWPWKAFAVFSFLPASLTDFFYKVFASNRYRLFGKRDVCRIPTAEERARFL